MPPPIKKPVEPTHSTSPHNNSVPEGPVDRAEMADVLRKMADQLFGALPSPSSSSASSSSSSDTKSHPTNASSSFSSTTQQRGKSNSTTPAQRAKTTKHEPSPEDRLRSSFEQLSVRANADALNTPDNTQALVALLPTLLVFFLCHVAHYVSHNQGYGFLVVTTTIHSLTFFSSSLLNHGLGAAVLCLLGFAPTVVGSLNQGHLRKCEYSGSVTAPWTLSRFIKASGTEQMAYVTLSNPFALVTYLPFMFWFAVQRKWAHWAENAVLIACMGVVWYALGMRTLSYVMCVQYFSCSVLLVLMHGVHTFDGARRFPVPTLEQFENRTLIKASCVLQGTCMLQIPPVLGWIDPGVVQYHFIHHINPGIPCYKLREAYLALLGKAETYMALDSVPKLPITRALSTLVSYEYGLTDDEEKMDSDRKHKHSQSDEGKGEVKEHKSEAFGDTQVPCKTGFCSSAEWNSYAWSNSSYGFALTALHLLLVFVVNPYSMAMKMVHLHREMHEENS